jgi:type IV pilus assembly protein PilQ
MILRKSILSLFIIMLALYVPVSGVRSEIQPEITGIDVRDVDGKTEIAIESSSPLSYTIYKPDDPYSVTVELQGVSLGSFQDRMVFDRAGVLEITPSRIEEIPGTVKLIIALTDPVDLEPVQTGNTLVLSFVTPETDEKGVEGALAGMTGGSADTIEAIDLAWEGDKLLVTISGNGQMTGKILQADNNKLIIDIPHITSSVEAPGVYVPPVGGIRIGQYPDKARIVFDLEEDAVYDVSSMGEIVVVSFNVPGGAPASGEMEEPRMAAADEARLTEEMVSGDEPPETTINPCGDKDFVGKEINLDIQDADLVHVFRLIADISEVCNIVVSPKIKGNITIRLDDVPWNRALDVILRSYGLDKRVDENIIRVAPSSVLAQEEDQLARAKETKERAGDLKTMFFPINYGDVKDIRDAIDEAKVLSQRGFVGVDERTSAIIIRDVEDKEAEYAALIRELDKPPLRWTRVLLQGIL